MIKTENFVYLSGKFIDFENIVAPLSMYGYGAYTTLKYSPDGVLMLDKHLERLQYNCKELNIEYPSNEKIIKAIIDTINKNGHANKDVIVRISLFPDHISWANPQEIKSTPCAILVSCREMYYLPQSYKIKTEMLSRHMPHLKTISYIVNFMAKSSAREAGYHDGLFVNDKSNIAEGTAWNIFFIREEKVFTPPTESGLLAGITRGSILEICKKLEIEIIMEDIPLESISNYEAAFQTNATQGPHAIMQIDETMFDINNETFRLIKNEHNQLPLTKLAC